MEYGYIMTFNLTERVPASELLKNISTYFLYRNITHQGDLNTDLFFLTNYQGNSFRLTVEENKHFGYIIRIQTDYKTHPQSVSQGFIKLIWDMLTQSMNISYSDIELFEKDNFSIIEQRYGERLISRKSMCEFLEKPLIEALPIHFEIKEINNIRLTKGFLTREKSKSFELAWYSFSTKLEYDGWDMTTAEFVPLTLEEYQKEIIEFTDLWKDLNEKDYDLKLNESPLSIIRTAKGWDYNEYLVKCEDKFLYVGTDIYTG